jgi:hypothetical protein
MSPMRKCTGSFEYVLIHVECPPSALTASRRIASGGR